MRSGLMCARHQAVQPEERRFFPAADLCGEYRVSPLLPTRFHQGSSIDLLRNRLRRKGDPSRRRLMLSLRFGELLRELSVCLGQPGMSPRLPG